MDAQETRQRHAGMMDGQFAKRGTYGGSVINIRGDFPLFEFRAQALELTKLMA